MLGFENDKRHFCDIELFVGTVVVGIMRPRQVTSQVDLYDYCDYSIRRCHNNEFLPEKHEKIMMAAA